MAKALSSQRRLSVSAGRFDFALPKANVSEASENRIDAPRSMQRSGSFRIHLRSLELTPLCGVPHRRGSSIL